MEFICVDIQGFSTPDFEPKEMTIITSNGAAYHYLFRNQIPFMLLSRKHRRTITWLERNHLGIMYGPEGVEFAQEMFSNFQDNIIYVKGTQKKQFMDKYFKTVVNLEYVDGCPNLCKTTKYCTYHCDYVDSSWSCSYVNCQLLCYYIVNGL